MLDTAHIDGREPESSLERTAQQLKRDYQRLLGQLRCLLQPYLEQMRAAPAHSPEAVLGELLWPILAQPEGTAPVHQALEDLTAQRVPHCHADCPGLNTEAIAAQLYIAPTTVKVHRRNIRKKLGLVGLHQRLYPHLVRQVLPPTPGGHTP